jgi:hypothetical protein
LNAMPAVFAYGAYRHYRDEFRGWLPERGVLTLFRSDRLLPNPNKWLMSLEVHQFDAVIRALRDVFGIGFSFIMRDVEAGEAFVVTEIEGVTSRTPLSSVSSGFRTILALMCDAMRWLTDPRRGSTAPTLEAARALVLIDEVEAHLHPRWKLRVMEGLRKALPGVTFLATTHDPLCLRGMRHDEVRVLQRRPGAYTGSDLPVLVETLTELPDMAELTVDQLLTADFFGLFDTDDPAAARAMLELTNALRDRADGRAADPAPLLRFQREVRAHLPVGRTEVARLIEDAVADYLLKRQTEAPNNRGRLRDATRARIVAALEGL